jgi:hypothetical protein
MKTSTLGAAKGLRMDTRLDRRQLDAQRNAVDTPAQGGNQREDHEPQPVSALGEPRGEMPCPVCGHPMPDLKGGKDSICPACGFKDSCCY